MGVRIDYLPIPIGHDNSATINSDSNYANRNQVSFRNNKAYFDKKVSENNLDQGVWSLATRRANSWD